MQASWNWNLFLCILHNAIVTFQTIDCRGSWKYFSIAVFKWKVVNNIFMHLPCLCYVNSYLYCRVIASKTGEWDIIISKSSISSDGSNGFVRLFSDFLCITSRWVFYLPFIFFCIHPKHARLVYHTIRHQCILYMSLNLNKWTLLITFRGIRPHRVLKLIKELWEVPMCRAALHAAVYLGSGGRGYKGIPASHLITAIRTTLNVNFENVSELGSRDWIGVHMSYLCFG